MNPSFDVERWRRGSFSGPWGEYGPAARLLLHDYDGNYSKEGEDGKAFRFLYIWGPGEYRCQGAVFELPSAIR
jgi:hypothetical protein